MLIDKWRGDESLYNHRHPNVLDTKIPDRADEEGRYVWTWAPADAVKYRFFREGMAEQEAALTATGREQTITLPHDPADPRQGHRRGHGPADRAVPRDPGHRVPARAAVHRAQQHEELLGRDLHDRARSRQGLVPRADRGRGLPLGHQRGRPRRDAGQGPRLPARAAPALEGRVVDPQGEPVKGARVYLATPSQVDLEPGRGSGNVQSKGRHGDDGRFAFPAQFERFALMAVHDNGYADWTGEPDQQPGELTLKAWARIEGRLLQAGKPVPDVWITFEPLRLLGPGRPTSSRISR